MIFRLIFTLTSAYSYTLNIHPLENRIGYIKNIENVNNLDTHILNSLRKDFKKHPLLIFKNVKNVSPQTFLDFSKEFDLDADLDALNSPLDYQHQMLQPFDQFPDCKHVAPRGLIRRLFARQSPPHWQKSAPNHCHAAAPRRYQSRH